jgi:aspartyl-tRNA(Asn)/glutamyl-tRNA(Gln) amidotransferase subunit A
VDVPEAAEREGLFPVALPAELIATLGRERFEQGRGKMDPVVAARAARGLEIPADQYIRVIWRHRELIRIAEERMAGMDGWITPAAALQPVPVSDFEDLQNGLRLAFSITKNSQPVNLFGQCGVSLPIHHLGAPLPVGLQIACPPNAEDRLLAIARAVEQVVGIPPRPDLNGFLSA